MIFFCYNYREMKREDKKWGNKLKRKVKVKMNIFGG